MPPTDPEVPDSGGRVVLAVPMCTSMIERIDAEVEREQQRTGGDYTRDQYIRHAVVALSERLEGERYRNE